MVDVPYIHHVIHNEFRCKRLLQRNSLYRTALFAEGILKGFWEGILEGILGSSVPSIILVKTGLTQITI